MKPTQIYNQLKAATEKTIRHYKTDLTKHDKRFIFENEARLFLHVSREHGTAIFFKPTLEEYPNHTEPVKYLFGKATRSEILDSQREALEYRIKEGKLIYFYTGQTLKKITGQEALKIWGRWSDNIKRQWNPNKFKEAV